MAKSNGHCTHDYISPEYNAWKSMMNRCYNLKCKDYPMYGGRGIVVCERWKNSFVNFLEDMGLRSSNNHSLDRFPDNENGIYEKSNCRWATIEEQNDNRRITKFITYNGITQSLRQWAKTIPMTTNALWSRIFKSKWSIERALTTPPVIRKIAG